MARRIGLMFMAALLAAAMLPATVAAAPGNFFHGGKPTAQVIVTCALTGYDYDVIATVDPDVVIQMVANGEPVALAWQKTSAKLSAFSLFLDYLDTGELPDVNVVFGQDLWGEGDPFTYVLVQVGFYDPYLQQLTILASGTGRCKPGDIGF